MTWKVPGYVVQDLLGFGGAGEVWRGQLVRTGQPVALKRVALGEPTQVQAARAEAALLSTLDHPHLVHLHELVAMTDAVVLVLDFAGGGSLADLLRQRGRLAPGEVITALAPIGAALAYAHNQGVLHGDVSTGNVLFTDVGLPLLADLGVARIIGDDRPVRCTPAYIDPAIANGHPPGTSSDVFSLAAVAVHALSGQPLWSGGSSAEIMAHAATGEFGDLGARLHNVPPAMLDVLTRALVSEPHLRCTAAEFALDLRHSGVPLPVERTAGRPRIQLVRPAVSSAAGETRAESVRVKASLERPSFERPGAGQAANGESASESGQLTHGVRVAAPDRPVATGALGRWLPRTMRVVGGRPSRKQVLGYGLVVAGALIVLAAIGVTQSAEKSRPPIKAAASDPSTRAPSASASVSAAPASTAPVSAGPVSAAPVSAPPVSATAPAGPSGTVVRIADPRQAQLVLAGLDDLRQAAFAQDDVALLAQVYLPGELLLQDSATLDRAVPPGCSLVGVHTNYSDLVLTDGPIDRTTITATATLLPSVLMCGGVSSGQAPGSGPTSLRIELANSGGGYRIVTQRLTG